MLTTTTVYLINNVNFQGGQSGDASVQDNTTGGNATSGAVSNTNSTSEHSYYQQLEF